MKILSPGDPKKAEEARGAHWWVGNAYQCGECECIIELALEDVRNMQSESDGSGDVGYTIPCPSCFSGISLDDDNEVRLLHCKDCSKQFVFKEDKELYAECKDKNKPLGLRGWHHTRVAVSRVSETTLCQSCRVRRSPPRECSSCKDAREFKRSERKTDAPLKT